VPEDGVRRRGGAGWVDSTPVTLVTAHRGASAAHPPGNTLAAFRAAGEVGADWVELDVRHTADAVLVVHHDADLPDGRAVAGTVVAELPDWVPTLTEALEACGAMGVNVEIKVETPGSAEAEHLVAATVALLDARPDPSRFLVTSFDWSAADRVRALAPRLATGLLAFDLSQGPDLLDTAVAGGHRSVNPWDPYVTPELLARAHALGLAVHTWTVDDPERIRALVAMGVDSVITNHPDLARRIVDAAARDVSD
jgi:glycerophosphoryl diester phosphodiesterase